MILLPPVPVKDHLRPVDEVLIKGVGNAAGKLETFEARFPVPEVNAQALKRIPLWQDGRSPMILQVMTQGSKGEVSGRSGRTSSKIRWTNQLGKGNRQLAQIPWRRASSMETHRSMPLLWTRMVLPSRGKGRAGLRCSASFSTRTSSRLLA